jgi:hypothetical protein
LLADTSYPSEVNMRIAICAIVVVAVAALAVAPVTAQEYFVATLEGSQEVPPNGSTATGFACFTLNSDGTLDYAVEYAGLSSAETGAHIHGAAPPGVNAGVIFAFPLGTPKVGTFGPLTPQQISDLNDGLYYVNIHTTNIPGGEIRGQIGATASNCSVPVEESTWGTVKSLYE